MSTTNVLLINSSGRYEGSITRQVSDRVMQHLESESADFNPVQRDVASGLPFVDEAWINSNFTDAKERSEDQKKILGRSDELVAELVNADHIVIASPIYNFNIPASLKAWIDLIARVGLTFRYTDSGPIGLLENKKATIVMASGGVPIGSDMDMASSYLTFALAFIGIDDVTVIDATQVNYSGDKNAPPIEAQIAGLIN